MEIYYYSIHSFVKHNDKTTIVNFAIFAITAWKNTALGKKKPWSRTKSEQKVWNRRPSSQRFREMQDEEENNIIHSDNNGT